MIGWTGSSLTALQKYTSLHTTISGPSPSLSRSFTFPASISDAIHPMTLGVPPIVYAPSVMDILVHSRATGRVKRIIQQALTSEDSGREGEGRKTCVPVVLHLFSGAPYFFFPTAIRDGLLCRRGFGVTENEAREEEKEKGGARKLEVRGIIWDCGPPSFTAYDGWVAG